MVLINKNALAHYNNKHLPNGYLHTKFQDFQFQSKQSFQHNKNPQKAYMWNPEYQIHIHKAKSTQSIQFRHISHLFMLPNKQGSKGDTKRSKIENERAKKKKKTQVKTKDNKPDKKPKTNTLKLDPNTLSSAFAICINSFFVSTGHYCTSTSPPSDLLLTLTHY